MAKKSTNSLESFGWYVLRTPLFPVSHVDLAYQANTPEDYKKLFDNELFKEAIYLASHHLYERFERWLNGTIRWKKNPHQEEQKLIKSLLKYWLRASYRCTPFGTMAGVSNPAKFGEQTKIVLGDISRYNRIDAEYLFLATNELHLNPSTKKYYPNTTLYKQEGEWRYFERFVKRSPDKPKSFIYQFNFNSIAPSEYIDIVWKVCHKGATKEEAIRALMDYDIGYEDANAFFHEMMTSGLLAGGDTPTTVGEEYQNYLLPKLKINSLQSVLKKAKGVKAYQHIQKKLIEQMNRKLPENHKLFSSYFQVDQVRQTFHNSLDTNIPNQIANTLQNIQGILPRPMQPYTDLQHFANIFIQRYETSLLPVNEVLDPENGISYPKHSLSLNPPYALLNIPFRNNTQATTYKNDYWQNFLTEIYSKALSKGEKIIHLNSDQLKQKFASESQESMWPETFEVMVSLGLNQQIHIKSITPQAGKVLGRFGLACPMIADKLQEISHYEQSTNSQVIYAEIAHLPANPKMYNILNRPNNIREYKIVLDSNPDYYDSEEVILSSDLKVGVLNGEILLVSTKLNKRIIPMLTTAHNQRGSNYPLYNFLSDLSHYHTSVPNWYWGYLNQASFLPRVEIDNLIFSPATWRITKYEDLLDLQIPKKFLLTVGDNKLLINQDDSISKEIFCGELTKAKASQSYLTIEESLTENIIVKDTHLENYANEFCIPFRNTKPFQYPPYIPITNSIAYLPGQKWLYVKIYGGYTTTDQLLRNEIVKLTQQFLAEGLISTWFFVRYNDSTGDHIRLRFKLIVFDSDIFNRIHQKLLNYHQSGVIRLSYDTYQAEVHRYGGIKTLELCESIFFEDSKCIIDVTNQLITHQEEKAKVFELALGIQNVDHLLSDFGLDTNEKQQFCQNMAKKYHQEFNVDKPIIKHLAQSFRSFQQLPLSEKPYNDTFGIRSKNIADHWQKINSYVDSGKCSVSKRSLWISLIHMSLNRFFKKEPRKQEMMVYDHLSKLYQSINAKHK